MKWTFGNGVANFGNTATRSTGQLDRRLVLRRPSECVLQCGPPVHLVVPAFSSLHHLHGKSCFFFFLLHVVRSKHFTHSPASWLLQARHQHWLVACWPLESTMGRGGEIHVAQKYAWDAANPVILLPDFTFPIKFTVITRVSKGVSRFFSSAVIVVVETSRECLFRSCVPNLQQHLSSIWLSWRILYPLKRKHVFIRC